MTVLVDLLTDTVSVDGSIDELDGLAMDYDSYIDMFKSQAAFFVAKHISDPEKYYDELTYALLELKRSSGCYQQSLFFVIFL